jgi:hypothetical protein
MTQIAQAIYDKSGQRLKAASLAQDASPLCDYPVWKCRPLAAKLPEHLRNPSTKRKR